MILNSYALLLAFVALLRLLLGLLTLVLAATAWRVSLASATSSDRGMLENRFYLLLSFGPLLLGLNLVSWPLLYLLLQSYVPEWPGVMCIYGVTQIGKDSLGSSRFLPDLLSVLQLTKPALVFTGGAWFVVYLLNRRTRTAPLLGRLLLMLVPIGAFTAAEALAELAYVIIPKKEVFASGGCCTSTFGAGHAGLPSPGILAGESGRLWLSGAYYAGNVGLITALFLVTHRGNSLPGSAGLAVLLLAGLAVLVVSGLFLIEVVAPKLLGLPFHHCPYDLIPVAPEGVVAVTFFGGGCFFLGSACIARWLGRCAETDSLLPSTVRNLLRLGYWAYLMSLLMISIELALA